MNSPESNPLICSSSVKSLYFCTRNKNDPIIMPQTRLPSNSEKPSDDSATTEQVAEAKYQCPMKCEGDKTYDEPGKCPKCGMDLKKVEE